DGSDEVIKVETELVNLNVRVIDRNNRPINGIPQSEFKIFEDGAPQRIEFFSTSEVPTNYSMVIDNSGSLRQQIDQIIEASKILVNTNKPQDETSIIRFVSSDKIEILQDFTANKTDLNDALDSLYIEGGQTAIIDAVYLAAQRVTEYEKQAGDREDRKRRALVLISDGADVSSFYTQAQLFDLLRESEVQIYVVGFINDLNKDRGFIRKSEHGKSKTFLEKLAADTGGRAFFPTSTGELNGIAKEIATELRTQYSIGYIPTNDRQDGSFRNIKVAVTDGPNSQKRIAVTRSGRTAGAIPLTPGAKPAATPSNPN
ncbi:MAG: VWA domain-containing protein, partial [Acidobacteria bacterium]|nr:VWA domain-containing protein [Acidobacteriota bacterium]